MRLTMLACQYHINYANSSHCHRDSAINVQRGALPHFAHFQIFIFQPQPHPELSKFWGVCVSSLETHFLLENIGEVNLHNVAPFNNNKPVLSPVHSALPRQLLPVYKAKAEREIIFITLSLLPPEAAQRQPGPSSVSHCAFTQNIVGQYRG